MFTDGTREENERKKFDKFGTTLVLNNNLFSHKYTISTFVRQVNYFEVMSQKFIKFSTFKYCFFNRRECGRFISYFFNIFLGPFGKLHSVQ